MNKVKAWCVSDGSELGLYLWSCSALQGISKRRFIKEHEGNIQSWEEAEKVGFKCVRVEIKEVSGD